MNSEEQTLIDGLFSRLQQAETDSAPATPRLKRGSRNTSLANRPLRTT